MKQGMQQPNSNLRTLTFEELAEYDGRKRPERYLCIMGHVFDVTEGKNSTMYKKPLPYSCFVGRDATTAFVSGDFDGKTRPLSEAWDYSLLNAREMADAVGWTDFYRSHPTYKHVGMLVYPEGQDPRERAVDPYDPLVEQSGAVNQYRVGWVCAEPLTWVALGLLRVNYKNAHGGIKALMHGSPNFQDDQVERPPVSCWAADVEVKMPHSLVAIWSHGMRRENSTLDSQIKLAREKPSQQPHFVFWGVTSSTKHFCGKSAGDVITRGTWVTPEEARKRLQLAANSVLCLMFVCLDETLPAVLPDTFWNPDTVFAIHFANVGSMENLLKQGFEEPASEKPTVAHQNSEPCAVM